MELRVQEVPASTLSSLRVMYVVRQTGADSRQHVCMCVRADTDLIGANLEICCCGTGNQWHFPAAVLGHPQPAVRPSRSPSRISSLTRVREQIHCCAVIGEPLGHIACSPGGALNQ